MDDTIWQIRGIFGLLILAFIFQVFSFVSPWWSVVAIGDTKLWSGLWQACVGATCAGIPLFENLTFLAVRGLAICGLILGIVALCFGIKVANSLRINAPVPSNLSAFPIFSIVAGVSTLIGCVIYGSNLGGVAIVQLHISFGAAVVAASLEIILGIIGLVLRQRHFNAGAPPTQSFTQFQNLS